MRFLRTRLFVLLLELAVIGFLVAWFPYGPPTYWRSFVGKTHAEVAASIGEPHYDGRFRDPGYVAGQPFFAWWPYAWGSRLCMEFDEKGVVTAQWRQAK